MQAAKRYGRKLRKQQLKQQLKPHIKQQLKLQLKQQLGQKDKPVHEQKQVVISRYAKPLCKILKLIARSSDDITIYHYYIIDYEVTAYNKQFNYRLYHDTICRHYLDNEDVILVSNQYNVVFYYDTFYKTKKNTNLDGLKNSMPISRVPDIYAKFRAFTWHTFGDLKSLIIYEFPSLIDKYEKLMSENIYSIADPKSRKILLIERAKNAQSLVENAIKKRNRSYFIKSFIISLAIRNENNPISRFANNRLFDKHLAGEICQFFFG